MSSFFFPQGGLISQATTIKTTSLTALDVQNASGTSIFKVDTSSPFITATAGMSVSNLGFSSRFMIGGYSFSNPTIMGVSQTGFATLVGMIAGHNTTKAFALVDNAAILDNYNIPNEATNPAFYLFSATRATTAINQYMKFQKTATSFTMLTGSGGIVQTARNSATADGDLANSSYSVSVDEVGNNLIVKVKYSDGTIKTGTLATLT